MFLVPGVRKVTRNPTLEEKASQSPRTSNCLACAPGSSISEAHPIDGHSFPTVLGSMGLYRRQGPASPLRDSLLFIRL